MRLIKSCTLLFIVFISCSPSIELQGESNDFPTGVVDNYENNSEGNNQNNQNSGSEYINLLFVGNSLTYTNDLPKLVEALAKSRGEHISTKMIAKPNYAIIDHLDYDNEAENEIKSKKYDYVIVQQGPSSQSEGRDLLFEGARRFSNLCKNIDTELVIFMVWPSRTYYYTFDGVIRNHSEAASMYEAILCPVGREWKTYFESSGDFSYYGSDQFHPSLKGSEEAARIILNTLLKYEGKRK